MAGGMRCAWHFSAKGQLSGSRCQRRGEEGEITAAGAHSSLFSVSITQSIFLLLVSISVSGSSPLTSGQSHLSFGLCHSRPGAITNHSPPPTLNSTFLSKPPSLADPAVLQIKWPFEMECTGFGSPTIRADRPFQKSRAAMSDSELGGNCSAAR